jgi:DNA-directed RNA polymerase subunit omega
MPVNAAQSRMRRSRLRPILLRPRATFRRSAAAPPVRRATSRVAPGVGEEGGAGFGSGMGSLLRGAQGAAILTLFHVAAPFPGAGWTARCSNMIEALKSDHIVEKLGGRFKLTALIQRRLAEIIDGARPLVERNGRSDLEVVIEEIAQDKISLEIDPEQIEKMRGAPARKR